MRFIWSMREEHPPPDIHTHRTSTKQAHHYVHALPSVRNSQLWHFVSAVSHFLNSAEIILALLPSPPSPPSQQGRHKVTASITYQPSHIICWLLSQNRGSSIKVIFFSRKEIWNFMCVCCAHISACLRRIWAIVCLFVPLSIDLHMHNSSCPCHVTVSCVIAWPTRLLAYAALCFISMINTVT